MINNVPSTVVILNAVKMGKKNAISPIAIRISPCEVDERVVFAIRILLIQVMAHERDVHEIFESSRKGVFFIVYEAWSW